MLLVCELFGVIGVGEASSLSSLLATDYPLLFDRFVFLFVQRQVLDSIFTARLYRRRNVSYSRYVFEQRVKCDETRSVTSLVR